MSEQLGLADKVKFTGPVSDIDRYYIDSDILLLPTRYEPFSNVVLEAMRGGNAVITTRQNGAAEILQNELIMDQSSDEMILPVMRRLLDEPEYLEDDKKSQQRHCKRVFNRTECQRNAGPDRSDNERFVFAVTNNQLRISTTAVITSLLSIVIRQSLSLLFPQPSRPQGRHG